MTTEQRREIEVVAREMGVTIMHVARLAILAYLDQVKAKRKAEAEQKAAEKAEKARRRGLSGLAPLGERAASLGRLAPLLGKDSPSTPSRLAAIFDNYAREILAAGEDELEVKRLVLVTVNAARKAAPLTCPNGTEILRQLEAAIVRLRDEGPAEDTRSYDSLVGAVVNAAKIKTRGDVE